MTGENEGTVNWYIHTPISPFKKCFRDSYCGGTSTPVSMWPAVRKCFQLPTLLWLQLLHLSRIWKTKAVLLIYFSRYSKRALAKTSRETKLTPQSLHIHWQMYHMHYLQYTSQISNINPWSSMHLQYSLRWAMWSFNKFPLQMLHQIAGNSLSSRAWKSK